MPPTISGSQRPTATSKMSSRQRPLHACGVSILAIADIAFGKTQDINGPLGSTLRKMAKLAKFVTPFFYAMQYQFLAILSFIDDRILSAEKMTEKLFPPSTYAFDKIDEIVLMVISLPEKFDGAVNTFPAIIHEVPFLEWALTLVILRLNSLASTLNHWGQENSRMDEKTIGVDRSCSDHIDSSSASERYLSMDSTNDINSESIESFPPIPEAENKGVHHDMAVSSQVKGSYKEALERGKEEKSSDIMEWESEKKIDEDECEVINEGRKEKKNGGNNKECESFMKYQVERSGSIKDDPLLELFESAWLMKSGRY